MSSTPKKQHYLAQSYLKRFCREYLKRSDNQNKDDYRAWYYDIERKKYRKQHINKIACERYFYSWNREAGEKDFSIETSLSQFENTISPLIQEIDEFEGESFMAMEHVDGEILKD